MTSAAGLSCLSSMFSFDPSQMASRLISSGDQDGDSALSFSEFSGIGNAASSGNESNAISSERMTNLFNAIDTDSDGSLTESELTEFGQKLSDAVSAFMLQMQEQSQSTDAGGASQSTSDDPLDTNKDGVVSFMERLAGSQETEGAADRPRRPGGFEGGMEQFKSMLAVNSYQTADAAGTSSLASVTISLLK